mgnify:CR=1 FL=1
MDNLKRGWKVQWKSWVVVLSCSLMLCQFFAEVGGNSGQDIERHLAGPGQIPLADETPQFRAVKLGFRHPKARKT